MSRTNVAILGAGRIGKLHAANLVRMPNVRLRAIVDPIAELDEWLDLSVRTGREPDEIFGDPEVEAVLICAPTPEHLDLIEQAARAGKHVFCEKPIDLDPERVVRALAAVEESDVKLQVGFNRRFDPSFRRTRQAVIEGEIGSIHLIRIVSRDPAPPPIDYILSSGGLFIDMMIHDFDMVRYLSGEEIVEVHSFGAVRVDPEIGRAGDLDTAVVSMRLESGSLAVIENCRQACYGYDQRVEVSGSRGGIEAYNETPTRTRVRSSKGVRTDKPLHSFTERYSEAFRAEIEAFISAIREDTEPAVDGRDGLISVLVAQAAQRSLEEGRPIKVDLPTESTVDTPR